MEQPKNEISIELNEQVAQGTYSNLAIITHSTSEFIVDFVRLMPGMPKAPVVSRVILTPEHAKRLLNALQDNVNKFEKNHGVIKVEVEMPPFPMNFGGNAAQA
ncbi:MAG: DUF3467 domain-containing protein [Prevotellaceae bacterium]|jgi:hypothetical protein|nr:DUF3467 domain-containing protein [Prevotellaceae bacterium]